MNSNELSTMTGQIFNDTKLRNEFLSDPRAVIARYNLNELEAESVISCQNRLGLVSADSVMLNAEIGDFDNWI
jgi:hypothetical protein